ncbi:MAG: hypothetical protein ACRDAX_08235 [Propionibacteriaceae bacterium]
MRELKHGDCKGQCTWQPSTTEPTLDGEALFSCTSCGTEWTPSQSWTPRNADGEVSEAVQAAKDAYEAAHKANTVTPAASLVIGERESTIDSSAGGGGSW